MKTLYLIRGVSGSGKSTLASEMASAMDIDYVEADAFCYNEAGDYAWEAPKLGDYHKSCFNYARWALEEGNSIIVSNTSTTNKEVEKYQTLAEKFGAKFVSIVVENRHGGKNVHNVPNHILERQRINLKDNLEV